jgi:hypothetical protein
MERIEAHAIDKFGGTLDVPDGEIAGLAGLQRAAIA